VREIRRWRVTEYRYYAEGELDIATAPGLRDDILEEIRREPRNVVVDFVDVTFLDCSGIRILVDLETLLAAHGRHLRLVHLSRAVRRPIDLLRLTDMLQLADATSR
jgi:anti-anti-sigma factor